jgi:hypothetical protein
MVVFKLEVLFWHLPAGIEEATQNASQHSGSPGQYSAIEPLKLEQQQHDGAVKKDPPHVASSHDSSTNNHDRKDDTQNYV